MPTENNAVITNRFCPKEFLVPQGSMFDALNPINGESIDEFEIDCKTFVDCLNSSDYNRTGDKWKVYPMALDDLVMRHIKRCGRILFEDLLIYLDLFHYFLYADNINEENLKLNYPRFTVRYLNNASSYLKDSHTLLPFHLSPFAEVVRKLNRESEIKLGV